MLGDVISLAHTSTSSEQVRLFKLIREQISIVVTQEYSVLRIAAASHRRANTCIASVYFLRTCCRVFKLARCDAAAHKRFSPTSDLNAKFPALFHPARLASRVWLVCYVQSPRAAEKACARARVSRLVFYTGIALRASSA